MNLSGNQANWYNTGNVLRVGVASAILFFSGCSVVPESSQRFDVDCNENPVEADFKQNKAIFVATIGNGDSAAVIVSQDNDEYSYTVEPYGQAHSVEFIGSVSQDASADIDALAAYGDTEFKISVDPDDSSVQLSVTC